MNISWEQVSLESFLVFWPRNLFPCRAEFGRLDRCLGEPKFPVHPAVTKHFEGGSRAIRLDVLPNRSLYTRSGRLPCQGWVAQALKVS